MKGNNRQVLAVSTRPETAAQPGHERRLVKARLQGRRPLQAVLRYASPAWWGYTGVADKQLLEGSVQRAIRLGLYTANDPTEVGGRRPLPPAICGQSDPPRLKKSQIRPISAYNVSTTRASENSSIISNGSRPRIFQRAIDEIRTLSPTPPKGVSKSEFVVFMNKIKV